MPPRHVSTCASHGTVQGFTDQAEDAFRAEWDPARSWNKDRCVPLNASARHVNKYNAVTGSILSGKLPFLRAWASSLAEFDGHLGESPEN